MKQRRYPVIATINAPNVPAREWTERTYEPRELTDLLGLPSGTLLVSMSWGGGDVMITTEET